jgi:hypothetical protein
VDASHQMHTAIISILNQAGECKKRNHPHPFSHPHPLYMHVQLFVHSYTHHTQAPYKNANAPKEMALYFYTAELQLRHHISTAGFIL